MAIVVPELTCSDYDVTLNFYIGILGFRIVHATPDHGYAFLEREGAELMIDTLGKGRTWTSGTMERPFGRGLNLRIEVKDIQVVYNAVKSAGLRMAMEMEDIWYPRGKQEKGNRQFIVSDPDGYLLRFYQDLGLRDVA
jgi:catechol 2,3-dioxygenase-like lactoylglutathione lyase family enzyme